MKKLLLIPDYLKKSSEKIIQEAKFKHYLICFYPFGDIGPRKIIEACSLYEPDKIVAVGSKLEYSWKRVFVEKKPCSFNPKIISTVTLDKEEVENKKLNQKNLEEILGLID